MSDHAARPASTGGLATSPSGHHAGAADGASTRERILDVALELFVRKGYAETSLREIAAALGFSKAALYYHFESKQDILLALHMRLHQLTEGVLPLLHPQASEPWEPFLDRLIGLALQNRRILEMHARNQEAIAELHRASALQKHGPVGQNDVEAYLLSRLRDPAQPAELRVRRVAAVGALAGVLLAANALADVPDAELETILRGVVRDVLGHQRG